VRAVAAVRAGSSGYVAPEQARAEAVDPRADVFSTGCLLYELLTLDRAFPHEGVWVAPAFDRLPEAMRRPIERALALDPAERPADASAFLGTLGDAITRHAATFSESDLAAHLRMLYPDGRWSPPAAEPGDDGVTPTTAVRPTTMTFATRLTSIDAAATGEPGSGDGELASPVEAAGSTDAPTSGTRPTIQPLGASPAAPRRGLLAALAIVAVGVTGLWVWSSRSSDQARDAHGQAASSGVPSPVKGSTKAAVGFVPATDASGPLELGSSTETSGPLARTRSTDTSQPLEPDSSTDTSHPLEPDSSTDTSHPLATDTTTDQISPPPALVLHVEPDRATVRIGTQRFEGGSPFTLPLPTHGVLEAVVEHPGHAAQTVELRAGEAGERTLVLRPVVPQGRGSLQVFAPSVSWAEVTVDGRRFGVTPTRKLELSAGDHRVVVRCIPDVCLEPRILLRRTVEIEPGQTLRLTAE
jgi:hypothetical protein